MGAWAGHAVGPARRVDGGGGGDAGEGVQPASQSDTASSVPVLLGIANPIQRGAAAHPS